MKKALACAELIATGLVSLACSSFEYGSPIVHGEISPEPPAEPEPVEHPGGTFESNAALEVLRGVTVITGNLTLGRRPGVLGSRCGPGITGDTRLELGVSDLGLSALSSLESVGGNLELMGNSALTSLTGLESLTNVGGSLFVFANDTLTSLTGLDSLTDVGGDLFVCETSLEGLNESLHDRAGCF